MDLTEFLNSIPEWFGGAIITAIIAALGWLGLRLFDYFVKKRTEKREAVEKARREAEEAAQSARMRRENAIKQLEGLQRLLKESYSNFVSQNYQRNRLMSLLLERHGEQVPRGRGYDDTFFQMYDRLEGEELELFKIIRRSTQDSMHRMNERLMQWLEENVGAKELVGTSTPTVERLDTDLAKLRGHLTDWFAKYNAIFITDERRSLVYLGDEKTHGREFPKGIEVAVANVLEEIKGGAQ